MGKVAEENCLRKEATDIRPADALSGTFPTNLRLESQASNSVPVLAFYTKKNPGPTLPHTVHTMSATK